MCAKGRQRPPVETDYLTLDETAYYSKHGIRTVQRWMKEGLLPYHRVAGGRRVLVRKSDLDAFLQAGRIDPRSRVGRVS